MLNSIDVFHDNRVKPSIDKVTFVGRSNFDILHDDIEMLVASNNVDNKYMYEHYASDRFCNYCRLHKISYRHFYDNGKFELFTLIIKVGFNGIAMCGVPSEQRKFEIEYNPNKFVVPLWLANYFAEREYLIFEVKNIDVAFDFIGFDKRDFRYVLNSGQTKCASIGSLYNKTDYIGFASKSSNRIKIYDKRKERLPYYDLLIETARVEITLEYRHESRAGIYYNMQLECLQRGCDALKQIYIADNTCKDPLGYALSCLDQEQFAVALSLMSDNSRRKYKKMVKEQGGFSILCECVDFAFFLHDEIEKIMKDSLLYFRYNW